MKMNFILWALLLFTFKIVNGTYDRNELSKKYPGFGTNFLFLPHGDGYKIGYLNTSKESSKIFGFYDVEKDVKFTLYTRNQPKGVYLKKAKLPKKQSIFDPSRQTAVVTHGWLSDGQSDTTLSIKNAFLEKYDMNVFVMDWSNIAGNVVYPIPMRATSDVAEYYGQFLNHLIQDGGLKPKDLHLIGHSLGAHISGFAARYVKKGKVSRVTGLDPALPGFESPTELVPDGHLKSSDAEFVDVIHTCAGIWDLKKPLGHADFYPNGGGPPQPGCGSILEMIEACSHGTSWKLFANSILDKVVLNALPCPSFDILLRDEEKCNGNAVKMGYYTPRSTRGIYYLHTTEDMISLIDVNGNFV